MDGRAKGILPIKKIPLLYYEREDKEVFYPLLLHINRNRDTPWTSRKWYICVW